MHAADRYRRVPGLVIYWAESQAVCFTWRSAERVPITFEAASLLDHFSSWTTVDQLAERLGARDEIATVERTIDLLLTLGMIERETAQAEGEWMQWTPEATFFHFATKNGVFPEDLSLRDRQLAEKATQHPPPAPTKRVAGSRLRLDWIAPPDRGVSAGMEC
jgi:hypothetical protein